MMKRSAFASLVRGINLLGGLVCLTLIAALLTLTPARAFDNGTWTFPFTGTGNNSPQLVKLNNTGTGYALSARSNGGVAVYGSSGTGTGISGDATTAGAYGVVGYNYATTGSATGIYGATYSGNGSGVYGQNLTTTAAGGSTMGVGVTGVGITGVYGTSPGGYGVYGFSKSGSALAGVTETGNGLFIVANQGTALIASGLGGIVVSATDTGVQSSARNNGLRASADAVNGVGVSGEAQGSSGIGVFGYKIGAGGYGVFGQAGTGTNAVGVMGYSTDGQGIYGQSTNGSAGYFQGNVTVTGTITGAVKNFKIDDPRDPSRKYLVHASIESDQMQNLYSGKVILNSDGKAVVQLPSYVETLNGDFQYQLTAVGAAAPDLHIDEEVKDGRFSIAGGKPQMKVCWMVTGVRHDPYAEAHPMQVEQEKTGKERGRYLNPELYGKPDRMREHYQAPPSSLPRHRAATLPVLPKPRPVHIPTVPTAQGLPDRHN